MNTNRELRTDLNRPRYSQPSPTLNDQPPTNPQSHSRGKHSGKEMPNGIGRRTAKHDSSWSRSSQFSLGPEPGVPGGSWTGGGKERGGKSVMGCLHPLSYEVSVPIEYPELLSWVPIELSTKPCGELGLWQIIDLPILAVSIGGLIMLIITKPSLVDYGRGWLLDFLVTLCWGWRRSFLQLALQS